MPKNTESLNNVIDALVAIPQNPSAVATSHSVERTNSEGEPFQGTCCLCGATGLTSLQAINDHCPNPRRVTQGDAFFDAMHRVHDEGLNA